jgi:hypothetical protein
MKVLQNKTCFAEKNLEMRKKRMGNGFTTLKSQEKWCEEEKNSEMAEIGFCRNVQPIIPT